jgi:hypothetical protein
MAPLGTALLGRMRLGHVLVLGALVGFLSMGCTTRYIVNTDVEDTVQNREIIDFCEKYRKAVEGRNVELLLKLADPRYYEDGGNADATDDLDYAGLREYLEDKFKETRSIRYEIRYRRVNKGKRDVLNVDFTYTASFKIPTPAGPAWRRRVADNRLELVPAKSGSGFTILSGM